MPFPNKLKGKEEEILRRRAAGETEFKLAIAFNVYPNAIRELIRREMKRQRESQPCAGK